MKKVERLDIIEEATSGAGVSIPDLVGYASESSLGDYVAMLNNQTFTGVVNLSRTFTHYLPYTPATNIVLTIAVNPITMGSAFVRMIGDGASTPNFTAFKKIEGSQDYDTTLNAVNACSFTYDGVDSWYYIDKEAV